MSIPVRQRLALGTFVSVLVFFLAINLLLISPYLLAVLTGLILCILARPWYRRLCGRRVGPKTAAALVTLAVALVVVGPLVGFGIRAIQQKVGLARHLSETKSLSPAAIVEKVTAWRPVRTLLGDGEAVKTRMKEQAQEALATGTTRALSFLKQLPALGLQIALALLSFFFFLVDGNKFLAWMGDKIPLETYIKEDLYGSFRETAITVIWATLAAASAQAAVLMVAYLVLGVPAAFLAAGATFIFAWISVLGSTPVWFVGAIYLFFQERSVARAIAMVSFGIAASLVDNFVRPLVLKGRAEMHPLVSLVAIFGGIHFFGLLGVFFGPILMAILITLLKTWPSVKKRLVAADEESPATASRAAFR